ncbi:hypothetical protein L210DRAFT_3557234, partial [Boletus edulis BED1]
MSILQLNGRQVPETLGQTATERMCRALVRCCCRGVTGFRQKMMFKVGRNLSSASRKT